MLSSCTRASSSSTLPERVLAQAEAPRPHAQPEGHVLEDGHVPEQRVVLEDEPDAAVAGAVERRVVAVEMDRSRVGRFEAGDDAEQRRLARARWPEQRDELPRPDLEAHIVQRREGAESPGHTPDPDTHTAQFLPCGVGPILQILQISATRFTMRAPSTRRGSWPRS
jgi:hypothetical protein